MTALMSRSETRLARTKAQADFIKELVAKAAEVVAPVWPLKTFIAVNPLQGLEHLSFEQAVAEAHQLRATTDSSNPAREAVNRELIKWCSTYFDEGQATIPMPCQGTGLYRAFAELARYDGRLNRSKSARALLTSLPHTPERAIAESLEAFGIDDDEDRAEFLRQALAALPGWAGYVKWKEDWQDRRDHAKRPASLVEYVAVRLILTRLLWPQAGVCARAETPSSPFLAELPTREAQYRQTLLQSLIPQARSMAPGRNMPPAAQLVFCIDVRSEPFRRALEARGAYETFGFAGFFGLPVRVREYGDTRPHDSCPVLLKPQYEVDERACAESDAQRIQRHDLGRRLLRMPSSFYQWLKYSLATPFSLVEMLGPWLGLRMLWRTFAPSLAASCSDRARDAVMPAVCTVPDLDAIPLSRQADYAESALRMIGLTENLAPLVVLCGHGSTTTNNAYASALDCGACGGNHGGVNARILAAMLNNPDVRALVAERGVAIPGHTLFLAAEHDTTTDKVELYCPQELDARKREEIDRLSVDLAQAARDNAATRTSKMGRAPLGGEAAARDTLRRSSDWAEVRPEWGLARNAAFIVGPRQLTRSVDLDGRCFLHSYDWKTDPEQKFLTTILTAPMVVGQWINSQYLFSTIDNVAFGAGSKVTHNVTGKLGVMQGNASDLMHGLPLQSVYAADHDPYHEPLRLLTVVHAPRSAVESVVRSQDVLQKLFGNGWVTLVCLDPLENRAYQLTRALEWQRVE